MRVSNKLFNEQQVRAFQSMRSDMQGIQEKIASGNKINRASDDPMGAVNLSAAREQRTLIEQFSKNSDLANMRLDLSDKTLDEMTTVLTRMTELTALAGNGVYDGFGQTHHKHHCRLMQSVPSSVSKLLSFHQGSCH